MRTPRRISFLAGPLALFALCALRAAEAPPKDNDKPAAPAQDPKDGKDGKDGKNAFEVRVGGDPARLLVYRDGRLAAAAGIRRKSAALAPLLPAGAAPEAPKDTKVLAAGEETIARFVLRHEGKDDARPAIEFLLNATRTGSGVRVLVSPALLLAKGAALEGAPPPLEWTLELYPGEKDAWPALKELDAPREVVELDRTRQADLPEPAEKLEDAKPFHAGRISFASPDGARLEVARSAPIDWRYVKTKDALQLSHDLRGDPREPARPGTFVFYLGSDRDAAAPAPGPLRISRARTPAWDWIEGALRVYQGGGDPFARDGPIVMAEIIGPRDGPPERTKVYRVPCFFWEGSGAAPAEGEYRFRFAPPEPGLFGVRVKIAGGGWAEVVSDAAAVQAGPPASAGFVKAEDGQRMLRFGNGDPYIPVGLNLAWPKNQGSAEEYDRRFAELARHGGNAARIWLSSWGLPLEGPKAGRIDPAIAEALDAIFLAAQARGVHLILVIENAHDLTAASARHPYFREQGGPLLATPEFFRDAEVAEFFQRRLTYLAARYGAYRSLLAWELLNEVDEAWPAAYPDPDDPHTGDVDADRSRAARRGIIDWAQRMGSFLSGLDAPRHPLTLSTALPPGRPWKELELLKGFSLVQAHGYVPEAANAHSDLALDGAGLVAAWAKSAREVGRAHRPYLLGEFGYRALHDEDLAKDAEAAKRDRNRRDTGGLLWHNAMFAGLAGGTAGTPMLWWWDRHVEQHNLWQRLEGPAAFAKELAALAKRDGGNTLRALSNESEDDAKVRVLGRVGDTGQCVWIQDRRSTWSRLLEEEKKTPDEIKGLEITLPALKPGTYRVRWLDTWSAAWTDGETLRIEPPKEGKKPKAIELKVPRFQRDIAVVVGP